jgi:tetratricopeptide (TPR) repeat protein
MFKDAPKENNSKGKSKITDEFTTNDDGSLSVAEENGPMIGWLHSSMPYFGGRGNNATIKFTNRGRCSDDCKGGHLHDDEWIRAISAEIHEHCERDWGWDFQPHTMVIETKYRQELEPEEVTSEKPLRTVENTSNKVVEVTSNEAAEETSNEAAEETCYEPTRSYQEEGEELKVKRVQVKRRALGETHVDTIESMRDLYLTHLQKGRWLDAEGMSRRIIESLIDELGADHPDTLDFMEQVAKNSNLLGREDLEEEMLIRLIEAKKRLFGIRHKDTISCLERLAPLLFRTGRISEAIALQKEVVETRMTHEGLVPIQSIEALAKLLFLQKNYDSAEPLVKQVLQFKRLSYGDEDVQTVMAMELMAKIYIFHGLRCQEAIQLQEQALVTRKATHGPEHPDTLQCQKDLAVYYNFDKQYEVAEMLFLEVINARKPDPEGPSKDNLQPLQFLAGIYQEQGRLSDYERTHQMVLETKIKTFGAAHPSTIKAKEIQASIYAELQKWEDARRLRQEILSSQRETHGLYEEAVLKSMIDLAITHNHLGLYNQARDMFSEVIDKAKDSLGPRHPLVQNATISLAATYRNMGLSRVAEDLLASLSLLRGDSDMAGPSCKCKKRNVAFVDRKLEDVDKTITQTREAIAALQNQPIDAVHLHWLGETYLHRYRVYTKHQSDLHMLHEWAEKALDATANNSSLKASLLKHWSKVLWLKFKKGAPKVQQYIDEAVEKAEEAVEIAGIHDLDSKPYLSYLSKMLLRRYKYTHDENDLDEARMWAEQAHLLESPPGEVNIPYKRGRLLHRFSKAHLLRFEQIGAPLDLDEGIKYEDASLESLPENACKRRGRLYKHARTLHIHYQVTKTVDSLDRALILCEKAVEMLPNIGMKSFSRAVWLQELSNMYRVRSEATPVDKDLASINYLRRSIDLGRESVDIASNPSLRLPLCVPLSSLAVSYRTLFQITDDRQDLEMALQAIGRATDATSKDDANYSALMDIQLGLQDMLQLWEARMMSLDN